MGQLIDGMLNLARISRAGLVREEVDLSRLAREIVSELENSEPERKATFEIYPRIASARRPSSLASCPRESVEQCMEVHVAHCERLYFRGIQPNGSQPVHFCPR